MRYPLDAKIEAVELYQEHSASEVIEILGLNVESRTIQRWATRLYGPRPTRRRLERRDDLRDAVVHEMEVRGLDRRYCVEAHRVYHPCLIRKIDRAPGVGSLVFVCHKHRRPGDM